ncbi:MAG TPA: cysteine--tRNA ligase [Pseudolabrys sp.]|nr:cysteine--tRNA ligase [Pseudolabrys sp.]
MELKLYDTLTREKRIFTPIDPARVRMYVCGPTVYDFAHIGNARPVIVFDVLFRLLRHLYGEKHVTYVRNVTDVDDKINARAAERGVSIRDLTEETYKNFKEDAAALGCLPPTVEPRATEHIDQMKQLIERLVKSGYAYVAEDNVLFHVPSMKDYGKLSNRPLDEMIAGARVEVAPYKKDPQDFILWKPSKPGEPAWPSPAGVKTPGRPGWHIECSAMAWKHLGETFDIHGGGIDLVFPHHENEIAQTRCAFHTPVMANYWMHNGFLQVEGRKMAKSEGNFITIRELLTDWQGVAWPGTIIRFALLQTHYRQPIDFTERALEEAAATLGGFSAFSFDDTSVPPSDEFVEALADDMNTPRAISELHRLHRVARDSAAELAGLMARPGAMLTGSEHLAASQLASGLSLLGFKIKDYDRQWLQKQVMARRLANRAPEIEKLIAARTAARVAKNFKESDRIRDELAAMGVVLKDSKEGTTWEVAR